MARRFERVVQIRAARLLGRAAVERHLGLVVGQPLILIREPENPVDSDAVRVCDLLGQPVGYVQRPDATAVAVRLDGGELLSAAVVAEIERVGGGSYRVARARIWSDGSAELTSSRAAPRARGSRRGVPA